MSPPASNAKSRLTTFINVFGPFMILAFVILFFLCFLGKDGRAAFVTTATLKMVLTQTVIVAIGALGMTMIIVTGGIDLSVGSVVALTSVIGALLIQQGHSMGSVVLLTILAGGGMGLINGSLIAGYRMPPFIVTLGIMGVARGMAKKMAHHQTVNFPESPIGKIMNDTDPLSMIPPPGVWVTIVLAVMVAVVMRQTIFGRHIYAVGSNEAAARLCGVRTQRLKVWVYSCAGLLFGVAGLMQLSRLRQGDPTSANGIELDIIAAVVIGGASLSGGTGSVLGAMIGALTMAVLRTGSMCMDWDSSTTEIIIGVLIILAVGLDRLRQSRMNA